MEIPIESSKKNIILITMREGGHAPAEIGNAMGISPSYIGKLRSHLKIPAVDRKAVSGGLLRWAKRLIALHASAISYQHIAAELDATPSSEQTKLSALHIAKSRRVVLLGEVFRHERARREVEELTQKLVTHEKILTVMAATMTCQARHTIYIRIKVSRPIRALKGSA